MNSVHLTSTDHGNMTCWRQPLNLSEPEGRSLVDSMCIPGTQIHFGWGVSTWCQGKTNSTQRRADGPPGPRASCVLFGKCFHDLSWFGPTCCLRRHGSPSPSETVSSSPYANPHQHTGHATCGLLQRPNLDLGAAHAGCCAGPCRGRRSTSRRVLRPH